MKGEGRLFVEMSPRFEEQCVPRRGSTNTRLSCQAEGILSSSRYSKSYPRKQDKQREGIKGGCLAVEKTDSWTENAGKETIRHVPVRYAKSVTNVRLGNLDGQTFSNRKTGLSVVTQR